jgi:hypothetical protein
MTNDRLEALGDEIAELSAHLQAAMCRWLGLVAQFDEGGGWASWGCRSCAHWLAYRCSLGMVAAREHVRVARRLQELPLVREAFGRGELSYSKVRALTRIEDIAREAELLELAQYATASQLERIVRGFRRVLSAEAERVHEERFVSVLHADDGSVSLRGRLSREEGAVLLKALEAMREQFRNDSAEAPEAEQAGMQQRNADALVALADAALAAPDRATAERFQVVVHVDEAALSRDAPGGRCELDDQAPLATETVRRVCCDASIVGLVERDGKPLSIGRKTRSVPPALRRALRSRDSGCRFPGCNQRRRVDAHHIEHWAHGGATALTNLVELCRHHHRLVHEGGYRVEGKPGRLVFRRPDGRPIPAVPRSRGDHDVPSRLARSLAPQINPDSCRPGWLGEPLVLGDAVDAVLSMTGVLGGGLPGG